MDGVGSVAGRRSARGGGLTDFGLGYRSQRLVLRAYTHVSRLASLCVRRVLAMLHLLSTMNYGLPKVCSLVKHDWRDPFSV